MKEKFEVISAYDAKKYEVSECTSPSVLLAWEVDDTVSAHVPDWVSGKVADFLDQSGSLMRYSDFFLTKSLLDRLLSQIVSLSNPPLLKEIGNAKDCAEVMNSPAWLAGRHHILLTAPHGDNLAKDISQMYKRWKKTGSLPSKLPTSITAVFEAGVDLDFMQMI